MSHFNIFLSLVIVVRNQADSIVSRLQELNHAVATIVSDYEIVIIDNASEDTTLEQLKSLTQVNGLPNLQVFSLTSRLDDDTASWVGMENALGDFILMIDPARDDIALLPDLLTIVTSDVDVVFACNERQPPQSAWYRIFYSFFNVFYKWLSGIDLTKEAPQYRLMSRRLVNFMLQHPHSLIIYRQFPAASGFAKKTIVYNSAPKNIMAKKRLKDGIARGIRLLISTSHLPMRLVTILSLFGALANLLYSIYVIFIMIWKTNVTPGWATLSLQQSGMFLLISLVLWILGEYILHIVSSPEKPIYHIAQEYTSCVINHRQKLNVETKQYV